MQKEYKTEDQVISRIHFSTPTEVRVTITDKHLNVFIGPRDFQFDLETGERVGSGFAFCGEGFRESPKHLKSIT